MSRLLKVEENKRSYLTKQNLVKQKGTYVNLRSANIPLDV